MTWLKDEIAKAQDEAASEENQRQMLFASRRRNIPRVKAILSELGDQLFGRGFFGGAKYKISVTEHDSVRIEGLYGEKQIKYSVELCLIRATKDTHQWHISGVLGQSALDSDGAIRDALKKDVGTFIRNQDRCVR